MTCHIVIYFSISCDNDDRRNVIEEFGQFVHFLATLDRRGKILQVKSVIAQGDPSAIRGCKGQCSKDTLLREVYK